MCEANQGHPLKWTEHIIKFYFYIIGALPKASVTLKYKYQVWLLLQISICRPLR